MKSYSDHVGGHESVEKLIEAIQIEAKKTRTEIRRFIFMIVFLSTVGIFTVLHLHGLI